MLIQMNCIEFKAKRTLWDTGNAGHAGQSSAGFCNPQVWIRQRELWGRAGQHSSTSAFACATQCSGHSLLRACREVL